MSEHTPGPWHAVYNKKMGWYAICTSRHAEYGGTNLVVRVEDYQPDEKEANARLIAAAPELLEALKGLIDTSQATPTEWVRACSNAAAAIAKAEGRT